MAETGRKKAADVVPSPMPVLLTTPDQDARYGEPTVYVVPGLIRLGSGPYEGEVVRWLNKTGDDVTFTFDDDGAAQFFDFSKAGSSPITKKDGEELRLPIRPNPPQNSIFAYSVECKATKGRPAKGGSPPEVSCP